MKGTKGISFAKNPEKFIARSIAQFVQKSPANRRKEGHASKAVNFSTC